MAKTDKPTPGALPERQPMPQGSSGTGIPAGTARSGTDNRPDIGDEVSGKRAIRQVAEKKTEDLAPEAKGGAGAGRKWAGDS
ncbi:hypothetical protein [Falsiroseomonas tokyonensis]|uniref:Uncharacterized protein n=1 Tax=Falsiroseomonas tokyonensis TaxID=430521 RepID=A0ABV7BQ61_9PROT|nr:hypothetical protein [Falsiroseomonas tokyonensis]MBU8537165.1 hypothetical protein [Falsiroseomonas tokyonensis]